MRKPIIICALVVCTCLMLGHHVWASGTMVLSHDEWSLSATGFSQAPDAATFAQNIASWFTGGGTGHFLVYSENFSFAGASPLCPTLIGAGHTCIIDTSLPFDLQTLQGFDGVFLAGEINGGVPDHTVLIQYIEHGGHVYLAGGTGEFGDASEEAAAWHPFLAHFGLAFDGSNYNGVSGTLPISSAHPLFVGVSALYEDNGSDIVTLDPTRPCELLVASASHGRYAVCRALPPEPATVAPPLNPNVVTDLATAVAFLYTGTNPIQTGVTPGTIDPKRAAVLRGKVLDKTATPLPGVTISVLNYPEFGQTLSRADGMFDMAVNGGGLLTVNYQKSGLLSAQRQVNVPWQDYVMTPDVVLIASDPQVTTVDLTAATLLQVARGSMITDADGSRQATLLFLPGTQAVLVMPDGSAQPMTTLSVRATEYTVGANGPNAMPGELPPSSGYTYAVELSADEAIAAGATEVRFSSPLPFYTENFVGFPVGSLVPTGFYDRGKGQWMASDNGRVIRVIGIAGGLADLDLDGNGTIDDATALAALGITDDERQRLASLYTPGQELWRALIPHLSPWDCNWPYGPPPGSQPPGGSGDPKPGPKPNRPLKGGPNKDCGSIIGCESQTLGEVVNVTGTPWSLHYQSDRVPGRRDTYILKARLSGATVPPNLQRIHLKIALAGREFKKDVAPQPHLVDTFTWDGKDAYGRSVQGQQPVKVRIGYEYLAQYYATLDTLAASFNRFGSAPITVAPGGGGGGVVTFSRPAARTTTPAIILWQDYEASLGSLDNLGLRGWTLSVHHAYDLGGRTLYLGNGDQRSATDASVVITTMAGTSTAGFAGDGGLATQAWLRGPGGVAVGVDGSLYIADTGNQRIRQLVQFMSGPVVGDVLIAAEDGSELYIFTDAGRHLHTFDALTGAVRFQFTYDSAERLVTITDGDGNVTTIERDGSGNPSAIVAPFGQRTTLAVQGDGYLSGVTNPAGEAVQLTYNNGDAEGLLATLTDPRGNVHRYLYDALGRLIRNENAAGGETTLARTDLTDEHYAVTLTRASGLVTAYEVEELPTGDTRRVRIDPSGARTESFIRTDGSRQVTYPDGTVADLAEGPDPRFGMQAPILKTLTVTTPGGITASRSATRTATRSDLNNLLSLISQTYTVTINGQIYTSTYIAATRQVTTTTPAGRQSVATLDAQGRIVEAQGGASFGLAPLRATYDNQGRLTQLAQGVQSWTYSYDAHARLTARTDAASGSIAFAYDAADRRQVTLPSGRTYELTYDASGNRTQVTMPSLGVHLLDYTSVDQEAGYNPPGNNPYVTSYDADARVSHVTLPSGRTETFSYDNGNRLTGLSYPEAALVFAYATGDPTTRVSRLTRTPTTDGSIQEILFTYGGDLVTGVTWSGAAQGQYTYTYDSNFLLKSMTLNSGADTVTTMLTRDNDGLLTGLGPFTFTRTGPAGNPSQISDDTLTITRGYDTLGRIEHRTHTVGAQQQYAVQFTYDTVGRITRKVETIAGAEQTYDYAYDADSQLSEVRREGVMVERYTYDSNRNRLSRQLGDNPAETARTDSSSTAR